MRQVRAYSEDIRAISVAYMQNILSQRGRLHTTDEAKQQVHHGRGVNVFQHQTNKAFFFL